MTDPRVIFHVDMDAFFASIEQLDNPGLRGRPVLVGSDRPRGVVAAASYEARTFGCRSAQPMAVARRLCPQAVVCAVRGARYREISDRVFEILEAFSPCVEPLSIDEAFLDMTGSQRLLGLPRQAAEAIRSRIRSKLNLTASIGIAGNKFLAKLASDLNKPDGLTCIGPDDLAGWFPKLPVEKLWGVGPATADKFHRLGIRTLGQLQEQNPARLSDFFGNDATRFHDLAHGRDNRPVTGDHAAKSIGQEQTFEADMADPEEVRRVLLEQTEQVGWRLRRAGLLACGIQIKIRFGDFQTLTRSATLADPTESTTALWQQTNALFMTWQKTAFAPVRLIGMAAVRLQNSGGQLPLFENAGETQSTEADRAADRIRRKFGASAIRRGGTLPDPPPRKE